ncbi:MAG: hypothetical protein AAFO79_10505, partial [Pseudomonadota bacterium]
DDSTHGANSGIYLETHLRQVIQQIEGASPVQLLAIGIGHDVTRYYQRAVTISDATELAGAMTDKLAELFEEDERTEHRHRKRERVAGARGGQGAYASLVATPAASSGFAPVRGRPSDGQRRGKPVGPGASGTSSAVRR